MNRGWGGESLNHMDNGVGEAGTGKAKRIRLRTMTAVVALAIAKIASAQTAAPVAASDAAAAQPVQGGQQLPAVVVKGTASTETATGPVVGYVAKRSEAGTKTDTPIIKVPQAISVVTRDQMDVQGAQSVAQALRYTSGINPEQRGTNTDSLEYLYARGFLVDEFWNGLRTPGPSGGFGYNVTSFDPYMFERIELLHGPASVLYGQGSPGGTVNLVSKMPTDTPYHEVGMQTGSYGRVQGFFDFSGPVDKAGTVLYRVTADGYNTGTQTDYVNQQRFSIAPTIEFRPSRDTTFTVFANYQSDPEAGIYNSVPRTWTSRSEYPGEPTWDSFRKTQESIGYQLEHRFNDTWSFKQSYRFLHNSETIQYVANDGFKSGTDTLSRDAYLNRGMVNSHTVDNQLNAKFNTGALKHNVTFGLDYQNIQFNHYFFGGAAPGLEASNPLYGQTIPYPTTMFATSTATSIKQLGVYAQDQIDIGKWSFLFGVREDWANEDQTSYKTGATTEQFNRAFTWRAGGVYQFDNGVAPYFSYSRSFQPQVGTSYSGEAFAPLTAEQYEVGVKLQPKGYNSFVTVSAFHITQNNVATTDPLHTSFSVLTGQVRSQGFEVEGHASLTNNLQLIASYTYTNLLNTKSNTSNLDKVPVGIPRNTASLWADYTVSAGPLAGLLFGGGVRYIGGSYGDTANSFMTSSATLVDLSLRYDLGRRFSSLQGWTTWINVSNLLDRKYFASCTSANYCYWGQGRLLLAGAKYQW